MFCVSYKLERDGRGISDPCRGGARMRPLSFGSLSFMSIPRRPRQDGGRCRYVECAGHGFCLHVYVHGVSNDKYDRGKDISI